jgi:hypothetical protein
MTENLTFGADAPIQQTAATFVKKQANLRYSMFGISECTLFECQRNCAVNGDDDDNNTINDDEDDYDHHHHTHDTY